MANRHLLVGFTITGIFLNGLVCYLSLMYNNGFGFLKTSDEDISGYEERFKAVKKDLPHNVVVGYITNETIDYNNPDNTPVARFFVTQYALSPIILANSPDHPFVLGNLHHADIDSLNYKGKGLVLVKDYGNGTILFRREGM